MANDNFPDPFGATLCVPHYIYFPLRAVWQSCFFWLYFKFVAYYRVAFRSALSKRSDLITWTNAQLVRRKKLFFHPIANSTAHFDQEIVSSFRRAEASVTSQLRALLLTQLEEISDEYIADEKKEDNEGLHKWPYVFKMKSNHQQICDEMMKFMDLSETCYEQMKQESYKEVNDLRDKHWRHYQYEMSYAAVTACMYLASLAACLTQFAKWYTADKSANASHWRNYQALFVALLHLPGLPLSQLIWFLILSNSTIHGMDFKNAKSLDYVLQYKLLFVAALLFPFIFTHFVPAYFTYGPLICVPIFASFIAIFAADNAKATNFVGDEFFLILLAFVFEMTLQMASISMVSFYSDHEWFAAFKLSLFSTHCPSTHSWVVFDAAQFSWCHWVVFIAWFF